MRWLKDIQPPAIPAPNINAHMVYQLIAAAIVLMLGIALYKTTIGKVLIVGFAVFLVLKVSGHIR